MNTIKYCPVCHKPLSEGELIEINTPLPKYKTVHRACFEKRCREFRLSPDEKALMQGLIDNYLEGEQFAAMLGISRDELVEQVKSMIEN